MESKPTQNRRGDQVVKALRRLLTATDRSLAAASRLRQARTELAKVVENKEGQRDG